MIIFHLSPSQVFPLPPRHPDTEHARGSARNNGIDWRCCTFVFFDLSLAKSCHCLPWIKENEAKVGTPDFVKCKEETYQNLFSGVPRLQAPLDVPTQPLDTLCNEGRLTTLLSNLSLIHKHNLLATFPIMPHSPEKSHFEPTSAGHNAFLSSSVSLPTSHLTKANDCLSVLSFLLSLSSYPDFLAQRSDCNQASDPLILSNHPNHGSPARAESDRNLHCGTWQLEQQSKLFFRETTRVLHMWGNARTRVSTNLVRSAQTCLCAVKVGFGDHDVSVVVRGLGCFHRIAEKQLGRQTAAVHF